MALKRPIKPTDGGDSEEIDEASLLVGLRVRDDRAFEKLVRAHGGKLLSVARRLLRNEEDAQDAVQEGFLSALKAIDRFEGRSRLYTWLHRIVVNTSLMKLRSQKRKPELNIDDLVPKFLEDGHQAHPAVEWNEPVDLPLQRSETRNLVRGAIDRLPQTYRTVLILRDIEELETEEAARILGVTSGVVKVRLHRARQALRGLLDPHFRRGSL